jgi:polysaccharide export outer membrane protein
MLFAFDSMMLFPLNSNRSLVMAMRQRGKRGLVFKSLMMVIFCIFLGVFAPGKGMAQNNSQWTNSVTGLTVFKPGDGVRIRVWDLFEKRDTEDLNSDYPINPEGFIVMPLIGEVRVKGVTPLELQKELEKQFRAYLEMPYVLVSPLIRLTLQGAFNKPGTYYAEPTTSVWNAIALADGPKVGLNLTGLRVQRGGKVVIPAKKFYKAYENGLSLEEVGVESGDQIIGPMSGGLNIYFFINLVNLFASILLLYLRISTGNW